MQLVEKVSTNGKNTGMNARVQHRLNRNGVHLLAANPLQIWVGGFTKRCRFTGDGLSPMAIPFNFSVRGRVKKDPGSTSATDCLLHTETIFTLRSEGREI